MSVCAVSTGLSRELVGGESGQEVGAALGTIAYTAPELFDECMPTKASDVYAFGILRGHLPL